jgi:hypothetical protein
VFWLPGQPVASRVMSFVVKMTQPDNLIGICDGMHTVILSVDIKRLL